MLERAAALVPSGEIDLVLELGLLDALFYGGNGAEALQRARSLAERAAAVGDEVAELCGRIKDGLFRTSLEPEGATEQLAALTEHALPVFEAGANDLALYTAYAALAFVENMRGQIDAALAACERAATHARQAGLTEELLGWRCGLRLHGTTPVPELLAWLDDQRDRGALDSVLRASEARGLAMSGRFEEGRAILAEARAELADRGGGIWLAINLAHDAVDVELLAGDAAAAVELGEEGCRLLDELGEQSFLSTAAGKLGRALCALGQLDEADAWADRAADLGASDDVLTQMLWRQVRAKVLAGRGGGAEPEQLARAAVAMGESSEMLDQQGDAYADLAEVLLLTGKPDEALAALEQAHGRYERKCNVASAQRTQARLDDLRAAASR
jgi:tetratricopeptide (TPR) repeat protein